MEGFPYIRQGSCFCKNTNRNLHSGKEEFHVREQEQEFSIGGVRKTNQRCPSFQFPRLQKDESHKRHDRQGELPAAARGNCWGGCRRKWSKGPLSAFLFSPSCLPWPGKEGCCQPLFMMKSELNLDCPGEHEMDSYAMAMPAVCFGLQGHWRKPNILEASLLNDDFLSQAGTCSESCVGVCVLSVQVLRVWIHCLSQFLTCLLPGIYFTFSFF